MDRWEVTIKTRWARGDGRDAARYLHHLNPGYSKSWLGLYVSRINIFEGQHWKSAHQAILLLITVRTQNVDSFQLTLASYSDNKTSDRQICPSLDMVAYFIDVAILMAVSTRCAAARIIWAELGNFASNLDGWLPRTDKRLLMRAKMGFELSTSIFRIVISTSRRKVSGWEAAWRCQPSRSNARSGRTRYDRVWH